MHFNTVCTVHVYKLIYKTNLTSTKYTYNRHQQVSYMFQQVTGAIIGESAQLLQHNPQNCSLHKNKIIQVLTLNISVKAQEYSQHKYLKHYSRCSFEHHIASYSTHCAHIEHYHNSTPNWIPRQFPDDHYHLMKTVQPPLTVCMMLKGTSPLVF